MSVTYLTHVKGHRSHTKPWNSHNTLGFLFHVQSSVLCHAGSAEDISIDSIGKQSRNIRFRSLANTALVIYHSIAQSCYCNLQFTMLAIYNSNESFLCQGMDCVALSQHDTKMSGQFHSKCTLCLVMLTNYCHYFYCLWWQYLSGKM